jgi:hypothetical protein
MAKYVMVVQSQAQPGRDDEYNAWYDQVHFHDILALPGVTSGRRFEHAMTAMGRPGAPYLAIYEVETDDPAQVLAELGKRSADGTMQMTDSIDAPASVMWFYKEHQL